MPGVPAAPSSASSVLLARLHTTRTRVGAWGDCSAGRRLPPGHFGTHERRHLRAQQLDRAKHLAVRGGAERGLHEEPLVSEDPPLEEDLLGDLLRAADDEGAVQAGERIELVAG